MLAHAAVLFSSGGPFGGGTARFSAYFALLIFSGLLVPKRNLVLTRRLARPTKRETTEAPRAVATPLHLNSIELALLAELNLELAHAQDEIAGDPSQRPEARRAASEVAAGWRERAKVFQMHARHQSAQPLIPREQPSHPPGPAYTGPERRRQTRRTQTRRADLEAGKLGGGDRRVHPDRRQGDRRRPQPAHR